jgi:hypothetical protein
MPGLLRFSKVHEGPASPLWATARTPFALMQQCQRAWQYQHIPEPVRAFAYPNGGPS